MFKYFTANSTRKYIDVLDEMVNNYNSTRHDAQRIEVPEAGSTLKFKNYNRSMRVPFVMYADFESFLKPVSGCQPSPTESYTNKIRKHTPSSFCYHIKCFDDSLYKPKPVSLRKIKTMT